MVARLFHRIDASLFGVVLQIVVTCYAATSRVFLSTIATLYYKVVTGVVGAIHMRIARFAALMAFSDDVMRNPLTKTLVKHEIFTYKLRIQSFLSYF